MQTANSERLVLVDMFLPWDDEDVLELEATLHKYHGDAHLRGEWFRSTPQLRALLYDLRTEWGSTWNELRASA